jgi:hypothetical protein
LRIEGSQHDVYVDFTDSGGADLTLRWSSTGSVESLRLIEVSNCDTGQVMDRARAENDEDRE